MVVGEDGRIVEQEFVQETVKVAAGCGDLYMVLLEGGGDRMSHKYMRGVRCECGAVAVIAAGETEPMCVRCYNKVVKEEEGRVYEEDGRTQSKPY